MKIDELNKEIKECKRCRLSEVRTGSICGEGNLNAKIMLIAHTTGEIKNREEGKFADTSGEVLNKLLKLAGIKRDKIYITNLVKCIFPEYRKPEEDEIKACSYFLNKEIKLINPKILVPLGYYPTRYIFQKYKLQLPSKSEFSSIYGKLFLAEDKKILPLPHPAVIISNPEFKQNLIRMYKKLKILLKDCKWYPVCPMKRFYERGKLDKKWIELYCKGDWESCVRYQMEEEGRFHPDWMLPDGSLNEELRKEVEG